MAQAEILALHTGVPERCYTQEQIAGFYIELLGERGKRRERAIRNIMSMSGVEARYAAVAPDFFRAEKSTQQRNDVYMQEAVTLGAQVIRAGLEKAGIEARQIDTLIVVSCTGLSIPGLDLLIAGQLAMRPDLSRTCVLGMGCYGAFPGIRRAVESIAAQPKRLALVLALELCTLHQQFDDSVETIVSTSLFGDGAGMLVIGDQAASGMPRVIDAETYSDYQTLDHMSFTVTDAGFRMYLSSYVPDVLAANVGGFVERLLARNDLRREDVRFWAIHPGSQRIVEYIQNQLALSDQQVKPSLDILKSHGNMSSATVLFVLERIMQAEAPQPGDYAVMMAFGPGLTMESLLVRW
jgi:predicted naringenin-chalcone synthase